MVELSDMQKSEIALNKISVTNIINSYHCFDREFWLSYKALEAVMPKPEFENIKLSILKSKKIDNKYIQKYKDSYELKVTEIDTDWKIENEEDKNNGIAVHEMIRNKFATDLFNANKEF